MGSSGKGWQASTNSFRPFRRSNAAGEDLVPAFSVDGHSGEELYYLGLLCREALDWQKATAALERYLSGEQQAYGPKRWHGPKNTTRFLRARAQNRPSSLPEVSYGWVAMAGPDLIHLYYLAGKAEQAQEVLAELNHFKDSHSDQVQGLALEQLEWANMEMHPAPSIPLLKPWGAICLRE